MIYIQLKFEQIPTFLTPLARVRLDAKTREFCRCFLLARATI